MGQKLRAETGQTLETRTVSGADSYTTGGNSVRTNIGSVNEATAEVQNAQYNAAVVDTDGNHIVVEVFDVSTGSEVAGGTDLSGEDMTYTAYNL